MLGPPVLAHIALSYPTGRLQAKFDRVVLGVTYSVAITASAVVLLTYSPRADGCARCAWEPAVFPNSTGAPIHAAIEASHRAALTGSVIDPDVVAQLLQRRGDSALADLTARERDILALIAEGRSNHAICQRLFLSPKTVETHVGSIFAKLGLLPATDDHRRVLAVLMYIRNV